MGIQHAFPFQSVINFLYFNFIALNFASPFFSSIPRPPCFRHEYSIETALPFPIPPARRRILYTHPLRQPMARRRWDPGARWRVPITLSRLAPTEAAGRVAKPLSFFFSNFSNLIELFCGIHVFCVDNEGNSCRCIVFSDIVLHFRLLDLC